jgi:PAS domain S-box-containing protein
VGGKKKTNKSYCLDPDFVNALVVGLDRSGNIVVLNKKGYEILGWPIGSLEGKNWFEYCLPPECRKEVFEVFKKNICVKKAGVEFFENEIITKKGEHRLICWQNSSVFEGCEKNVATFGVGRDITKEKHAEKELRASEEKYRALVEFCRDGIAIITSDGNLAFVNSYLAKLLKTTVKEMTGAPFMNYVHKNGAKIAIKIFQDFYSSHPKKRYIFESVLKDSSGNSIEIEDTVGSIDFNGQRAGLVIVRDISRRKKNEANLKRQNEELERVNRLLVGRELRVVELKKEIKNLKTRKTCAF